MLQKIIKVGNSYAVTIPKGFLSAIEKLEDKQVRIHQDYSKKQLIVDFLPDEKEALEVVNPEVLRVGKQLLSRYHDAFEELAKR